MPQGPGKYDPECQAVFDQSNAQAVMLIVLGGNKGSGFSVTAPPDAIFALPEVLRSAAESMDREILQIMEELNATRENERQNQEGRNTTPETESGQSDSKES